MKKYIYLLAFGIPNCSSCFAEEFRNIESKPSVEIAQIGQSVQNPIMLSLAVDLNNISGPQFPANLIPSVEAGSDESSNVEPMFRSVSELASGLNSNIIPAAVDNEPPIVVTGPRLPKPAPVPDDAEVRLQKVRREVARLAIAYHVLSLADGIATIHCVRRRTCKELNPLMGSRPSALRVLGVKALGGFLLHRSANRMAAKNPYKARSFIRMSVLVQAAITGFTMQASF